MRRGSRTPAWIAVALLPSLVGCGYSLAGRGDFLPQHIKIIGVPTFQNLTDRPEVEQLFTSKVVEELNSRGRYTVVSGELGADAVLRGKVTSFLATPAVLEGGEDAQTANQAARYTVLIRAEVDFRDLKDDKSIWSDSNFSFREEYEIGEDPEEFFNQEGMALTRLAEEFAKTLVSRILEAF